MTAREWQERELPQECFDPLNRVLSRPVFVELRSGPGEDEDDDTPEAA